MKVPHVEIVKWGDPANGNPATGGWRLFIDGVDWTHRIRDMRIERSFHTSGCNVTIEFVADVFYRTVETPPTVAQLTEAKVELQRIAEELDDSARPFGQTG